MKPSMIAAGFAFVCQAASAQQPVPIRTLAPVAEKTTERIGSPTNAIRQLPDGRLLVNDGSHRRLLVFDASLATFTVTADTNGKGTTKYSDQISPWLFPYVGDSTLLVDRASAVFLIAGPDGKITGSVAPPRPSDLIALTQQYGGKPGVDARGRLVYRATQPNRPPRGTVIDTLAPPPTRDTISIVAANFDTRTVDTVAIFTAPRGMPSKMVIDANGKRSSTMYVNPVPFGADDWAVLSDGSIAVVRALDYHIEWLYAGGTRASTPKMPFDWRRLTDEDKKAKVDSVRRFADSLMAAGRHFSTTLFSVTDGNGGTKMDSLHPAIDFVPLNAMSDYVAPIRSGTIKPDRDGNLWILPTTSSQAKGGLLYDVVNKRGELFERVQLPKDRDIAGFGPGGVVYLSVGDFRTGYIIEKT